MIIATRNGLQQDTKQSHELSHHNDNVILVTQPKSTATSQQARMNVHIGLRSYISMCRAKDFIIPLAYFTSLGQIDSPFCLQNCLFPLATYFAQLQNFQYDVARRVSKPHMSAKFHGLVLFSL